MTRREADRIIARIRTDGIQLRQSEHARQQLGARRYSPHDVRAILQFHEMETAPEWNEDHQNFEVRLVGKSLEGRPTRLVLGLRESGPSVLVTIMLVRDKRTKGRNK